MCILRVRRDSQDAPLQLDAGKDLKRILLFFRSLLFLPGLRIL
jgi:hypothetical protein